MAFTVSRAKIAPMVAKVESSYGSDSSPAAATDAFFTIDSAVPVQPALTPIDFNVHNDVFTMPPGQMGQRHMDWSFNFMLEGHGTRGSAHPSGDILQACGMTETVTAGTSVVYTPSAITALKSATLQVDHGGGILHKTLGWYGNCVMSGSVNDGVRVAVTGRGKYAEPTFGTLSSWAPGTMRAKAALNLGCTIIASGGGTYTPVLDTFSFDRGSDIQIIDDLNNLHGVYGLLYANADPQLTLTIAADMDEAAAWTHAGTASSSLWYHLTNITTHNVAFTLGADSGNAIAFSFPTAQLRNLQWGEKNGYRIYTLTYGVRSATDNAEFSISIT